MSLFTLRGDLPRRVSVILTISGILFILVIWHLITMGTDPVVPRQLLPGPWRVLNAFGDLYHDNDLVKNTGLSIGLNLAGYVEAILISIPVGFLIGLYPFFRGSFQREVDAIRYVPLTAVTGLFIVWFGVGTSMKVHFLAFGIIIYLLPVVVQRIDEVKDVYLKTVYTLGASNWQTIRTVYFPSVMSRLSDDIRVLTAISWTYIIVAEGIGSTGGIGSLIWRAGLRQWRMDKVFALLIVIMLIGVIQDKIFIRLDRHFFPHKYQAREQNKHGQLKKQSFLRASLVYIREAIWWIFVGVYVLLVINEFAGFLGDIKPLSYLFGGTVWFVNAIVLFAGGYAVYELIDKPGASKPSEQ